MLTFLSVDQASLLIYVLNLALLVKVYLLYLDVLVSGKQVFLIFNNFYWKMTRHYLGRKYWQPELCVLFSQVMILEKYQLEPLTPSIDL